jgi:hypothetical protein
VAIDILSRSEDNMGERHVLGRLGVEQFHGCRLVATRFVRVSYYRVRSLRGHDPESKRFGSCPHRKEER